jgi:hypothetical protein
MPLFYVEEKCHGYRSDYTAMCATVEGASINHYFRAQRSHRTIRLLCAIQLTSNLASFVYPSHDQRKLTHDALVTLD